MSKPVDKVKVLRQVRTPTEFFREWVKITISYSKLSEADASFLVELLAKRYELSLDIKNEKYLTEILFGKDSKEEMSNKLGMKNIQIWENKASAFRKKGIIMEDNRINPRFIPKIKGDIGTFAITFIIDLVDDKGQA